MGQHDSLQLADLSQAKPLLALLWASGALALDSQHKDFTSDGTGAHPIDLESLDESIEGNEGFVAPQADESAASVARAAVAAAEAAACAAEAAAAIAAAHPGDNIKMSIAVTARAGGKGGGRGGHVASGP